MKKGIKGILAVLGLMMLVFSVRYTAAEASTTSGDGQYEYKVDDYGNATITKYLGKSASLTIPAVIDGHPVVCIDDGWDSYAICGNNVVKVVIPDSVTAIGRCAFTKCTGLLSVTMNGVETIGDSAFSECTNLSSVSMNSVQTIGEHAFYGTGFVNFTLPESVLVIGEACFAGCQKMIKFTFNSNLSAIPEWAFNGSALVSVTIPENIVTIGLGAFSGCTKLTSIVIPDSVCVIDDQAFDGVPITSFTWPSSAPIIGRCAFYGCNKLTSIYIPDTVISIGELAFGGCTALKEINIPNSVMSLGIRCFSQCSSLTKVVIPEGVTSIPDYAFQFCGSLTTVVMPDTLMSIGRSAFEKCSNLADVIIPAGVSTIQDYTFECCYKLGTMRIPDTVESISSAAFHNGTVSFSCDSSAYAKKYAQEKNIAVVHEYEDKAVKAATTSKTGTGISACKYCGSEQGEKFTIPKLKSISINSSSFEYTGKPIVPEVTVLDSEGNTVDESNYSIELDDNVNVGEATLTICFKKLYSGEEIAEFKIKPKSTSVSSVKAGEKSLTVKWKAQKTQTTGYELQYSTSSKFASGKTKTKTIKKNSTVGATISNLKSGTKYYVRIRTYKTVDGVKIYSAWSKTKKVTVK